MTQMRFTSRLSITAIALALCGAALTAPLGAQQVHNTSHKSVSQDVHGAAKTTGRAAKSGVKSVASGAHHVLKSAGRGIKRSLKSATGNKGSKPHSKPGGLNKVAHDVSNTFKHAGRAAKSDLHGAASGAHRDLTTAGKNAKASVKDSTKP